MGKYVQGSSGCEVLDIARQMQKDGVPFEEIGRYTEGNCSGDCDKCQFNLAKKEKPKIYFLQHGNPEVKIIEYDHVDTEEGFMNMMAMALMFGHEDGTFTDKAFGYWNGTWYHSLPSPKEEGDGEQANPEKKEWWFCNKNGIMVYDQMCYDCCFIDEIIDCPDIRAKPKKTMAYEQKANPTEIEDEGKN